VRNVAEKLLAEERKKKKKNKKRSNNNKKNNNNMKRSKHNMSHDHSRLLAKQKLMKLDRT
jgi:hypothetical protein